MPECTNCRAPLEPADVVCPSCSVPLEPVATSDSDELIEGKWRLEQLLGRGGMGEVWRAHDVLLDRAVAIKVLARHFGADPEYLVRFEREARLMAKLDHPNLVPVHTVGRWRGGPFIVMKLLAGRPLAHVLKSRRLQIQEILALMRQVCSGLHCMHTHGIVHRDLKPGNIIVSGQGLVTLLDFGIARDLTAGDTQSVRLGTPRYMAPEQILCQRVDPRTDVYAAGAILYQMIAGRPLFEAFEAQDDSILQAHLLEPPPRISGLPELLWSVIARALAKERDQRHQSAEDLSNALDEAAAQCPDLVLAPPLEPPEATRIAPSTRSERVHQLIEPTGRLPPTRPPAPKPVGNGVLPARSVRRDHAVQIAGLVLLMAAGVMIARWIASSPGSPETGAPENRDSTVSTPPSPRFDAPTPQPHSTEPVQGAGGTGAKIDSPPAPVEPRLTPVGKVVPAVAAEPLPAARPAKGVLRKTANQDMPPDVRELEKLCADYTLAMSAKKCIEYCESKHCKADLTKCRAFVMRYPDHSKNKEVLAACQ